MNASDAFKKEMNPILTGLFRHFFKREAGTMQDKPGNLRG